MSINVLEVSIQYLIAIIVKDFLTKNDDIRQIKWLKNIKINCISSQHQGIWIFWKRAFPSYWGLLSGVFFLMNT